MTRWLTGAMLALALGSAPAMAAAERGVVLNDTAEASSGYCEGTVTASSDSTTTLAIDACQDGGVTGLAPGDTRAFPKAAVQGEQQGLAMAAARKRFFASPRIASILRGSYMPAAGEDFKALAALADQGGLTAWRAFIGMLQPMAALTGTLHAKRIAAYTAADFGQTMDAYDRYAVEETAAIEGYASAVAKLPVPGRGRVPGFGAAMLVQIASRDYDLPFSTAVPDAWLKLQLLAASTASGMLKTYRQAMVPLGLAPFFVSELKAMTRSEAAIRNVAGRAYIKAAEHTVLGVLTDAEYAKPDDAILADIRQALSVYSFSHDPSGRDAVMARAKAALATGRQQITATEHTVAAMEGRHWQLTIAETDGDPVRHYVMVFTRTGAQALEAKIYEKDLQFGNLILVLTWPVHVQADGDVRVNSAVAGVDNDFIIPAKAFATGHFQVRSEGFSEVFIASGTLRKDEQIH
jgi:hypothetical protein